MLNTLSLCGEQEVLDRMINLELFRPLQSTVRPLPTMPTLTKPSKIQVAEVEEDLAALGFMEGPVVFIECADTVAQDSPEVESCVTLKYSSPSQDEAAIGCQLNEGPTVCEGREADKVSIPVSTEAEQTEDFTDRATSRQLDEEPTACGGQKAVEKSIPVPSEALQTKDVTGAYTMLTGCLP